MVIQTDAKTIYHGDDMDADEGRALRWVKAATAVWPDDLTDAEVDFEVDDKHHAGVVVVAVADDDPVAVQEVMVELTNEQTGALARGSHPYVLRVTLAEPIGSVGRVVTLARGTATVV